MESKRQPRFAALVMICVLIGTIGLAASTCQEDCQDDRDTCDSDCGTDRDSCYNSCSSTRMSCDSDCDDTYNSCMSGCGGDPGCEMMCEDEWVTCKGTCSMNEMDCQMSCDGTYQNCGDDCSDTYDACIAACPPPPSITHAKGRYWVNHTWVLNCTDESVPTSYNVSINQTWHNGTTTRWYNNTGLQGGVWSNAIVMAWNATNGTICSVTLSENVYLPLPVPPPPVGTGSTWDFFWVNHTWSAGSDGEWAGDTDSFNVSIETHWINGTTKNEWINGSLTTFYNNSLDGEYGWSNITVWSYNATGGLSSTYIYQNVEVPVYIPPTPVNPQSASGRFWVNHTWSPGTGYYTDSYNVSLEGDGWHNGTLTAYYREQMSTNGWSNITVYAYNNTHHELSESALTQNVLISWTDDIFVNTSGWWRDGDVFNVTSIPFSCAIDNVTTGDSVRVYDGSYIEHAYLWANDVTITPVSGRPTINTKMLATAPALTIEGNNNTISGFTFATPTDWTICESSAIYIQNSVGSTVSDTNFNIASSSGGTVVAIRVLASESTISGGTFAIAGSEKGIDIEWNARETTVTGISMNRWGASDGASGIRIARSQYSPGWQFNNISSNSIQNMVTGIEFNASDGGAFDTSNEWSSNSVSGCTYGVKHVSSSIMWNGSAASNTHDHYFTGDTSGSVIQNPPSLANLYLADAASTCTITNTDGRMFDVCGARHEYIDDLAYAHPNGTFSRHISDSSPLQTLNLQFYDDFTITPSSAPVSVANIEYFGTACDATGGHDVEVDVASSTPANEVRFNITGDSTWINDYVNMNISGTFVKREKANITGFVSILYAGGFSSHHFEFDEIYIPAGEGGANPFLNPSFECQRENGADPSQTTFCNWSQTGSCTGNAPGCEHWWMECGATSNSGSGVCRTGSWHTDGDYSAWITSNIVGAGVQGPQADCEVTTKVYQAVDLTGVDTLQFDARLRDRFAYDVDNDEFEPTPAEIRMTKYIAVYVGGARVWWGYHSNPNWVADEGYHSGDTTIDFLGQEADVSSYSGVQTVELVSYIEFHTAPDAPSSAIDGWMQMQAFFDNIGVLYSVQPPENLLHEACPYWVNHTWDVPTGGAVIDSYNVSVNSVWHNGTTDPFYKDNSLTDWWQWSNITVYSYNTTDGLSPANSSASVQMTPAIPDPTDLAHTEGHIWIRHAWAPGSSFACRCVPTQSYNVSVNDVWYNGTTDTFYNDTGLAYEDWSNITVYAWNSDTGLISNNPVTQNLKADSPKPSTPVGGTGSWGFFWVNHSWSAGSDPGTSCTDSYNYSITTHPLGGSPSTIWYNDSTNTSHNNTLGTHGWSNITVYAWNDNATAGLSENAIYQDIEVIRPPPPATPVCGTGSWGFFWVNHSWSAGSEPAASETNSYNYSITTHPLGGSPTTIWYNDSTNTSHNNTLSTFGWSNITVWAWSNNYRGLSASCAYQNTEVIQYTPPDPTYIHNETDPAAQVWVNYSWACDEGGRGLADSFNISINSAWHNGTTLCNNNQPVPEDSDFEDNTLMNWNTSGSYAWTPTAYGYDSTYAIRDGFTGTATGSSTAWKNIMLDDYGGMYFDCKLNGGTLTVYNGSETLYEITGTHDWQSIRINLTAGIHTLKFTYQRPASPTPENHAWIDNVVVRQRVYGWYLASGIVDDNIDIVVWAWNNTHGGISEDYTNDSVYIGRIPRVPVNISHTTGMYWVNYTWEPVGEHDDSYNVSLNGVWHNSTTDTFYNDSGRMTDWGQCSAIAVYSYNSTLNTLSNSSIADSACLTPTLTLWNDYTGGAHTILDSFDQLLTIEFTCSSDAEMAMWTWTGVDSNGSTTNSKTTNGTLFVYEWKTHNITVRGTNATGTVTAKHTWTVTLTPPDDWYDPNYAFRKKVLVNRTCNTGHWWDQILGYHITVHLDTTLCAWSDCWDIFCYSPDLSCFDRVGCPWYTPRSQGYPNPTTNEEIYVQLNYISQIYPLIGGGTVSPPWELWIYYHNPSRTDKADHPAEYKNHCKGHGEILRINSTLTYRTVNGDSEDWKDISSDAFGTFYSFDRDVCHISTVGAVDVYQWMQAATTYAWYDDHTWVPYVLTQHGNNSLDVSTTVTCRTSAPWGGPPSNYHGLRMVLCDPRRSTSVWWSYPTHTIESRTPSGSTTSATSTLQVAHRYDYNPGEPFGNCEGNAFGAHLQAYSAVRGTRYPYMGTCEWDLTQCDLTYTSLPGPFNATDCVTVDDNSAQIGLPSPAIVVYDTKGNLLPGITYMIYDRDNNEMYSPWAVDGDGVIYFNDPSNRNVTLAIRTHEGVYTQDIPLTNGSLINMTVPITYNLHINAFDEGGRQLDSTICTLSEYTVRDPGFFWGIATGNRTSIQLRDLSSFGVCAMTVEKAGYEKYNMTNVSWTTQSTMISDYRHDVTLTTE